MGRMKHILPLALSLSALAASSCDEHVLDVKDSAFTVDVAVEQDGTEDSWSLYVTLLSGERDSDYSMDYMIDGSPVLSLTSSGSELAHGASLSFKQNTVRTFTLPGLSYGQHTIWVRVYTDSHSEQKDVTFNIASSAPAFHAETYTESVKTSAVLVSLTAGETDRLYRITVSEDGQMLASMSDVDFSDSPLTTVMLPVLRPGEHELSVVLSDGRSSVEQPLSLKEPVRYPVVSGSLSYDEKSNSIMLAVDENPYALYMEAYSFMTVDGTVSVNTQSGYFYGGPFKRSLSKSLSGETASERIVPEAGKFYALCCFDDLDEDMEGETEESWVWGQQWRDSGDGSSEFGWVCLGFTKEEPYSVSGHETRVEIVC